MTKASGVIFFPVVAFATGGCGSLLCSGKLLRRQVTQGAVRSLLVIVLSPAFGDHGCFLKAGKDFAVQTLVAQFVVKALDVGLFPG